MKNQCIIATKKLLLCPFILDYRVHQLKFLSKRIEEEKYVNTIDQKYDYTKVMELCTSISFVTRSCKITSQYHLVKSIEATLKLTGIELGVTQLKRIMDGSSPRLANDSYNGDQKRFSEDEYQLILNTIETYQEFANWDPFSVRDMQDAYQRLYKNITSVAPIWNKIEDLLRWAKGVYDTVNEFFASAVVYCELIQFQPEQEDGRLSRLWVSLMLSKINDSYTHIPFEDAFLHKDPEEHFFQSLILNCLKLEKSEILLATVLRTIREGINHFSYSVTYSDLKKYANQGFDRLYGEGRKNDVSEMKSYDHLRVKFSELVKRSCISGDGEKLDRTFNYLAQFWEPQYTNHDREIDPNIELLEILDRFASKQDDDILHLLYVLHLCQEEMDWHNNEKVNYQKGKQLNLDKQDKGNKRKYDFERCCIEVHNRNIRKKYKGGPDSPRSRLMNNCPYISSKPQSAFLRASREFEKRLTKQDKNKILSTKEISCPSVSEKPCIDNPKG